MAAEFGAQLAAVDAALMQPMVDPARRTQLWHERVEVLRAAAGFESTRRWLAANGERSGGALVRVHSPDVDSRPPDHTTSHRTQLTMHTNTRAPIDFALAELANASGRARRLPYS